MKHYDYHSPKVGDLVYEAYSPRKAGKIVEIVKADGSASRVKVRWVNDLSITECRSIRALKSWRPNDDHEKKLATHKATLARIEAL